MLTSVLGTGYLGATHAACLLRCGHEVVGIDIDAARIESLAAGRLPFHEPGLGDILDDGMRSGRLRFATDPTEAASAEVHFICVGTPQQAGSHAADLTDVWTAVRGLSPHLNAPCLVVGKSTVPVGTAAKIRDELHGTAPAGRAVSTAWNPEFLREGHAVHDALHPDRLVLGVDDDESDQMLRTLYAPLLAEGTPVVRTDLATAELAKVSANLMLAARISLVNVLAEVCEVAGADVGDLIDVLGLDARIGPSFLVPGIGYGGGCLPKDTRAFAARASELGVVESARLVREVDAVNMRQRSRTVDRAIEMLDGPPEEATVAVLGAAFKAGSDDVRDSPALDVATTVQLRGAQVRVYDPRAKLTARAARPELDHVDSLEDACRDVDLVMVLTDWDEFASIDPVALAGVVRRPAVIDGRLLLDADKWRAAGWRFHALGRGTS